MEQSQNLKRQRDEIVAKMDALQRNLTLASRAAGEFERAQPQMLELASTTNAQIIKLANLYKKIARQQEHVSILKHAEEASEEKLQQRVAEVKALVEHNIAELQMQHADQSRLTKALKRERATEEALEERDRAMREAMLILEAGQKQLAELKAARARMRKFQKGEEGRAVKLEQLQQARYEVEKQCSKAKLETIKLQGLGSEEDIEENKLAEEAAQRETEDLGALEDELCALQKQMQQIRIREDAATKACAQTSARAREAAAAHDSEQQLHDKLKDALQTLVDSRIRSESEIARLNTETETVLQKIPKNLSQQILDRRRELEILKAEQLKLAQDNRERDTQSIALEMKTRSMPQTEKAKLTSAITESAVEKLKDELGRLEQKIKAAQDRAAENIRLGDALRALRDTLQTYGPEEVEQELRYLAIEEQETGARFGVPPFTPENAVCATISTAENAASYTVSRRSAKHSAFLRPAADALMKVHPMLALNQRLTCNIANLTQRLHVALSNAWVTPEQALADLKEVRVALEYWNGPGKRSLWLLAQVAMWPEPSELERKLNLFPVAGVMYAELLRRYQSIMAPVLGAGKTSETLRAEGATALAAIWRGDVIGVQVKPQGIEEPPPSPDPTVDAFVQSVQQGTVETDFLGRTEWLLEQMVALKGKDFVPAKETDVQDWIRDSPHWARIDGSAVKLKRHCDTPCFLGQRFHLQQAIFPTRSDRGDEYMLQELQEKIDDSIQAFQDEQAVLVTRQKLVEVTTAFLANLKNTEGLDQWQAVLYELFRLVLRSVMHKDPWCVENWPIPPQHNTIRLEQMQQALGALAFRDEPPHLKIDELQTSLDNKITQIFVLFLKLPSIKRSPTLAAVFVLVQLAEVGMQPDKAQYYEQPLTNIFTLLQTRE